MGIERLPTSAAARRLSNEPKESMNCKSCRKRKIKCNRLRPTCEACQVFQCPCIYDAVPKKRGPKTDILEALLKRVDGLERRLKDEKQLNASKDSPSEARSADTTDDVPSAEYPVQQSRPRLEKRESSAGEALNDSAIYTPSEPSVPSPTIAQDVLLDTYFARVHGKPYFILDEGMTRSRLQGGTISSCLEVALYAVGARYALHPSGYHAAVRLSEDYAMRARAEVDIDDPCIDNLQTLLLLAMSFIASGKGKKAYMALASGVGMAMALELHRESDGKIKLASADKTMRRRLFWTCYLMDRFTSCGSKRPSLISDGAIMLRLPSWSPSPSSHSVEGEFFQKGSNLQYHAGSGKKSQGSSGLLIDIVRILGNTSRYLAAGGVKGDSHFPWHSLSNLSKIRQDLDVWASGTSDVFTSVDSLFGQSDSTILVLSKLVYHLIHCLIYRPFLPIDLSELAGTGQHQSWQIEATNLCFLHANAIAELVELGRQAGNLEWPAFVGYCICSAGTVHVHGSHYKTSHNNEVFSSSADFLSMEMQQLSKLRYTWACVQHQRDTLQTIYGCHTELVKSLASNPARYSPVFHLEDFFDRYSTLGRSFDGAHISFADLTIRPVAEEEYRGHNLHPHATQPQPQLQRQFSDAGVGQQVSSSSGYGGSAAGKSTTKKRKLHGDLPNHTLPNGGMEGYNDLGQNSNNDNNFGDAFQSTQQAQNQDTFAQPLHLQQPQSHHHNPNPPPLMSPFQPSQQQMPHLMSAPFSPPAPFYNSLESPDLADPMFGMQMAQTPGTTISQHAASFGFDQSSSTNPTMNNHNNNNNAYEQGGGSGVYDQMTPGGRSTGSGSISAARGSVGTGEEEKDPFLSLLEQLAENEYSRGGPSELDFFLGGQGQ